MKLFKIFSIYSLLMECPKTKKEGGIMLSTIIVNEYDIGRYAKVLAQPLPKIANLHSYYFTHE